MRMHNRRFSRLTNAFSKKFESHAHMVAVWSIQCNFIRSHKTLRVTPGIAAEISESVMGWGDFVALTDSEALKPAPRGPIKKRPQKFQAETLPAFAPDVIAP